MKQKPDLPLLFKQRILVGLGLCVFVLMMLAVYFGGQLKDRALRHWQSQATREVEGITNGALHGLALYHSQLRGLATLFYGSEYVSKDEFLDAISVLEDIDTSSPLGAWGLVKVENKNTGKKEHYSIVYSTENMGVLSEGIYVTGQQSLEKTFSRALSLPKNIVTGNAFFGTNGHRQVLFAITVPYQGEDAVLFVAMNLDFFFKDLHALHFPKGLNLRLSEALHGQGGVGEGTPILGRTVTPEPVYTLHLHTGSGAMQWQFHWDILPHYLGGANTALGLSIQWSGGILALMFFILLGHFSRESLRIKSQVQARTSELNWALEAAEKANDRLKDLSLRDGLTNIPNRRRFDEFLDREWKYALRHKGELSIILIDIDFFKNFNDTLGHTEGDACLKKVANILQSRIERATDLVARYGGEEFICVLPDTSLKGAKNIGDKLREAVSNADISHPSSAAADHVTISLGVATLVPDSNQFPTRLIKIADENLYKAKKGGRNRLVY